MLYNGCTKENCMKSEKIFIGNLLCAAVFLVGCASVSTPAAQRTDTPGVEARAQIATPPPDAAAIGKAMEEEEKPWKKKKAKDAAQSKNAQQTPQTTSPVPQAQGESNHQQSKTMTTFDRTRAIALSTQYRGAIMQTNKGAITLTFYGKDAPLSVGNFVMLAQEGFYDGITFHRVIKDFMIQTGDPTGTGRGGVGYTFEDEINDHKVVRGALAMANAGPNTNGSQFFIVTADVAPWLDGKHTVFGAVTDGMDVVDAIEAVKTGAHDKPLEDVVIERVKLIPADA